MRHSNRTYTSFDIFCSTVTDIVGKCIKTSAVTENMILIVGLISLIFFHVGVLAFLALTSLLLAGFIAYYGGIAALFAAHPVIATVLVGTMAAAGLGYVQGLKKIYDNKQVFFVIRDRVVNSYKQKFNIAVSKSGSNTNRIPKDHEEYIDRLVYKAVIDTLKGLMEKEKLTPLQVLIAPFRRLTKADINSWGDVLSNEGS